MVCPDFFSKVTKVTNKVSSVLLRVFGNDGRENWFVRGRGFKEKRTASSAQAEEWRGQGKYEDDWKFAEVSFVLKIEI